MNLSLERRRYRLVFKFDAKTSRGAIREKESLYLLIRDQDHPDCVGVGECGPLPGLSPENVDDVDRALRLISDKKMLEGVDAPGEVSSWIRSTIDRSLPSLRFGMEVALRDCFNGGRRMIFDNAFFNGSKRIPINGLIWMGSKAFMVSQIRQKLEAGFSCLKLKVGALALDVELAVLKHIRSAFSRDDMEIRLDANGAFPPDRALTYLERLSDFDIHSIEQPIRAGQPENMARLCRVSPIPIALDEELIGRIPDHSGNSLLEYIQPQYIILKPTLVGGIEATRSWIDCASALGIGWWMTSALESDIGLNAIAQLTAEYDPDIPQGLGTGQLFLNNFISPLRLESEHLAYANDGSWDLSPLNVQGP
jgi:o-succinylbenzoate synthase